MSDKKSIVISVIIPVHNAAGYISDTLSTVLSQTLNDIEIIIVNDCSDDNTFEIVSALAETDSRIRVINNATNLGGGGSRNVGLDAAIGEYVIFLDDDDHVEHQMLEHMYARAIDIQADVVICRSQSFDPALQVYAPMPWSVRQELLPDLMVFSSQDIPSDFFRAFIWWPWDKLLRRQFIAAHQLRFQEIRTTNDLFFVCAFMLMANRISVLDETLISHTINRPESLSATEQSRTTVLSKHWLLLKRLSVSRG
jgi:glycosyltransferase involved in cell wall biosynthesis